MRFSYGQAPRCSVDDQKVVLADEADADAFVQASDGSLFKQRCSVGNGWHVTSSRHEDFLSRSHPQP